MILPKGFGYYDLTQHPIGVKFGLVKDEAGLQIVRLEDTIKLTHGCNAVVIDGSGRKIAVRLEHCEAEETNNAGR